MLDLRSIRESRRKRTTPLCRKVNLACLEDSMYVVTKPGDAGPAAVGQIFRVRSAVDHECRPEQEVENLVKRLTSAVRIFGTECHFYQYLFRRKDVALERACHREEVIAQAAEARLRHLEAKPLGAVDLYVALFLESKPSFLATIEDWLRPARWLELFSEHKVRRMMESDLMSARRHLQIQADSFRRHVAGFLELEPCSREETFRFLRRCYNQDPRKWQDPLVVRDDRLDRAVLGSDVEAYRKTDSSPCSHLAVGDRLVRVYTLKELPGPKSFALQLVELGTIRADYTVVIEWQAQDFSRVRIMLEKGRTFFIKTATKLSAHLASDAAMEPEKTDALRDRSKIERVDEMSEVIRVMENEGRRFGRMTLTVLVHGRSLADLEAAGAEFERVFALHDAELMVERENQVEAWLSAAPGNWGPTNCRQLLVSDLNVGDWMAAFTPAEGKVEGHITVLETRQGTPYYYSPVVRDSTHQLVLGPPRMGKSFWLNAHIAADQSRVDRTVVYDVGGSYRGLMELVRGRSLRFDDQSSDVCLNPLSMDPARNLPFMATFVKLLMESGNDGFLLSRNDEQEVFKALEVLTSKRAVEHRTLTMLASVLPRRLTVRLEQWLRPRGQHGRWFDNGADNFSFAQNQLVDLQGIDRDPTVLEPTMYLLWQRMMEEFRAPERLAEKKQAYVDEAWKYLRSPAAQKGLLEALKTLPKFNAGITICTQSWEELAKSEILGEIIDCCVIQAFFANSKFNRKVYGPAFNLNEEEMDAIENLVPQREFLLKTADGLSKVFTLDVDPLSRWLYTTRPEEVSRREAMIQQHGFKHGLELLARTEV